jgi:hypothetical protein
MVTGVSNNEYPQLTYLFHMIVDRRATFQWSGLSIRQKLQCIIGAFHWLDTACSSFATYQKHQNKHWEKPCCQTGVCNGYFHAESYSPKLFHQNGCTGINPDLLLVGSKCFQLSQS